MNVPNASDLSSRVALDTKSLGDLKTAAKNNSPDALKGAAKQFEALFINMMMKSMRDATPQDGIMDSQTTKTFTTMLDQQMSQKLANRGVGLADMLVRQLSQKQDMQAMALGSDSGAASPAFNKAMNEGVLTPLVPAGADSTSAAAAGSKSQAPHIKTFQDKLEAHAEEASKATGIPAKFMLGQAALESGWGKRQIRNVDGTPSHNLFGIKADKSWTGKTVSAYTTEYVNGVPQTRMEKFRAYDSYADSFKDYARMLASNPRYEKVLASAGDAASFARGLQKAGYATDPFYAAKLTRIINHSLA